MIAETVFLDKWTYLVGIGILFLGWLILYFVRRDLHRRMLVMSILLLPLAPIGQYFFIRDYWHPPLILPIIIAGKVYGGVADLLFAFVMGGLATAAYPVISRRYPISGVHPPKRWIAIIFVAAEGGCVLLLTGAFGINSIITSSLGFVITAVAVVAFRRDLWLDVLLSGVVCGLALAGAELVLSFIVPFYLSRYWFLYHTQWGLLIFNRVPLTELMWGFAFGLGTGALYDTFYGYTLVSSRKRKLASSQTSPLASKITPDGR